MKKLIRFIFDNTIPICSFILPVFEIRSGSVRRADYWVIGVCFAVQLLCFVVYAKTRGRWLPFVEERIRRSNCPFGVDSDYLDILFATLMILLFSYVLPFGVYLGEPMGSDDVKVVILACGLLWLHRVLLFVEKGKSVLRTLPFLSLAGLIWAVITAPADPTIVTIALSVLCIVEISLSLARQFRDN